MFLIQVFFATNFFVLLFCSDSYRSKKSNKNASLVNLCA